MKILFSCPNGNPIQIDMGLPALTVPKRGVLYLNLTGEKIPGVAIHHEGELVLRDGWICLVYDEGGYLIELEIHEGDPYGASTKNMSYLQPKNPLIANKTENRIQ